MQMSGHDYLTSMQQGLLPPSPIARLAGLEALRVDRGDVLFRCVADASYDNPMGVVHGGLLCTLLDSAAAGAMHSTLPAGVGFTSIEIKVSYLRSVRAGDVLLAHGWVTKPGSRITFAEADVRDSNDRLVATASSTLLLIGG